MWIIGDVHGNFKTLKALLDRLPKYDIDNNEEDIYITGDLIDRGPRSKEVIQYLIDHPEIKCVKGNHEDFLIDTIDNKPYVMQNWLRNGGIETLKSYNYHILKEHDDYIRNLPDYIETDKVIISHTADIRDRWTRSLSIYPQQTSKFHVFGHTPVKKVILTEKYALIDTGCFYLKEPGFGKLTALHYPNKRLIQQHNID